MNKESNKVAVGYCRVSTDKQREESLDHQQREIQKYADENGIKIINWYIDHGYSGTTEERPDFQKMIEDSKKKEFNLVLVWKLDRFSRDKFVSANAKHKLKENGVSVFSVIERIENTPEGEIIESLFEAMNQYYVKNLARGVLGGMVENVRNGISVGSCTFGYMLTPKLDENGNIVKKYSKTGKAKPVNIYTLHPEHSATVKLIFDMFLAGASRNEILARLKECGYKNSKGGDFKATNIDKILRNERYTGVYILEYNKGKQVNYMDTEVIRNEGGLPKIIDKEDFDKVQQMLNARKHQPNARSLVSYLLTGKIVCGNCGAQFTGSTHYKNGQPYHYYRCGRNNDDCKMISIRKEAIENFVIKEIEKVVKSGEFVASILDRFAEFYKERNNNSEIIKRLEKNLQDIERKIGNLTKIVAETGKYTEMFETKLDALTDEKIKILANLKNETNMGLAEFITKDQVRRSYCKVLKLLKSGKVEDQRTIINTLLNRVVVYKDRVETFINILPYEGSIAEMSITNADLEKYGLLETSENENITQECNIPSDICFGSPKGNRTPDTTVKGWCLNRLTMGPEEKFVLLFYSFRKEEAK